MVNSDNSYLFEGLWSRLNSVCSLDLEIASCYYVLCDCHYFTSSAHLLFLKGHRLLHHHHPHSWCCLLIGAIRKPAPSQVASAELGCLTYCWIPLVSNQSDLWPPRHQQSVFLLTRYFLFLRGFSVVVNSRGSAVVRRSVTPAALLKPQAPSAPSKSFNSLHSPVWHSHRTEASCLHRSHLHKCAEFLAGDFLFYPSTWTPWVKLKCVHFKTENNIDTLISHCWDRLQAEWHISLCKHKESYDCSFKGIWAPLLPESRWIRQFFFSLCAFQCIPSLSGFLGNCYSTVVM